MRIPVAHGLHIARTEVTLDTENNMKIEASQDRLAPVLGTIELHRDKTFSFHQPHHFRIQHLQREHAAPGTRKF
ncbi:MULTISPECIES: hypothetical protein [unclassified Burkholderia]|uniref:hypothetical protein n=1 Tax=unclassified Burkholderia TaxID=2613784 RepID=UPI002ABD5EEB|nr:MULTISPECIES: hypothetical protein [unclassified Burkholderia]